MKKTALFLTLALALILSSCNESKEKSTEVSKTTTTKKESKSDNCDKSYSKQEWDHQAPHVDAYNFVRAETDLQMKAYSSPPFAFGKLTPIRKAYDVNHQLTVSGNRDTFYSFGVFDLSKSDLTIELPDSKGRYMTLMPISEDHDIHRGLNAPGKYTFKQSEVGTRYIIFVIRILVDPNDPKDVATVHKLQDGVKVTQADKGDLSGIPDWNEDELLAMRKAYNTLGSAATSSARFFGAKCDNSYLDKAMGVAVGWGGMQEKDAKYIPTQVAKNDGKTAYTITVPKDVPVDGFWSVTIYNQERYMVPNKYNSYSINSLTAKKNADGTATLHLGGDPKADNYLYIPKNWLYIVRFYQPHQKIIDGTWKFPEAVEVK